MLNKLRKTGKILAIIIGGIMALVFIILVLLNSSSIQNYLIKHSTNYIRQHYHADISLTKIRFSLSNAIIIDNLLLKDQSQDTLVYIKELKLHFASIHKYPRIFRNLTFYDTKINLRELDTTQWNYSFLLPKSDSSDSIDLKWLDYIPPLLLNQIHLQVHNSTQDIISQAHYLELILTPQLAIDSIGQNTAKVLPKIDIAELSLDDLHLDFFSLTKNVANVSPTVDSEKIGLLLRENLHKIFALPLNYQIHHLDLNNNQIRFHSPLRTQAFELRATVHSGKTLGRDSRFEQELKLEDITVDDWHIDGINLNILLNPEHLQIRELTVNQRNLAARLRLNIRYPDLYSADSAAFMHSLQGNGLFSVRNIERSEWQGLLPENYQSYLEYLPEDYSLELQPTNFNFTAQSLNIDSLSIYQNQSPLAKLGFQLHNWTNDQEIFLTLQYLILSLKSVNYPKLFARITEFWPEDSRPYLPEIMLKLHYEGTWNRGAGMLNVNNELLNLEQGFSIQRNNDSSLQVITRYNIQNPNGTLFPHNLSFGKINGQAQVFWENSGDFNIEHYQSAIQNLLVNGHFYKTILANGFLIHKILNGSLEIDDPGAQADIDYNLDLSNAYNIALNSNMNLHNIDWKNLGFIEHHLETSLALETNLTFKRSPDNETDIFGSVQLKRVHCTNDQGEFYLDDIFLEATQRDHENLISISSAELGYAYLKSSLPLKEIPIYMQNILHSFFPYKFAYQANSEVNTRLELEVQLRNFLPFNLLIHPSLGNLDSLDFLFRSQHDTSDNVERTHIAVKIPKIRWDSLSITRSNLEFNSLANNLFITGSLAQIRYADLVGLRDIQIQDSAQAGNIHFVANSDNYTLKFDLASNFATEFTDITLKSFQLMLGHKLWQLQRQAEPTQFRLSANGFSLNNLRLLGEEGQELELSLHKQQGHRQEGKLDIRKLNLALISQLFPNNSFQLAGLINLRTNFSQEPDKIPEYNIDFGIHNFKFNTDSIGLIQGKMHYQGSQDFFLDAKADNPEYNFNIYKNPNANASNLLNIRLNKVRARILQVYTQSFFQDIGGYLSGDLVLKKKHKDLFLVGKTTLQEVVLSVDYTKCSYTVAHNSEVIFENGDIIFPQIPILDKFGADGLVDGRIHLPLNNVAEFNYNFQIQGRNLLGLSTDKQDNPLFYGQASGDIRLNVRGNGIQDSLFLSIIPNSKTICNIDVNSSNQSSSTGALKFLSHKTKPVNHPKPIKVDTIKRRTRSQLSHPIYANPKVANQPEVFYTQINLDGRDSQIIESNIYLNRVGSNKVNLKGVPHLQLVYSSNNGLSMTGNFKITGGNLQLTLLENFQLKKEFSIDPNFNNFVQWSGDITNPRLNLRVQHLLERVPLNNLESLTNTLGLSNAQGTPTRVATSTTDVNINSTTGTGTDNINISLADLDILIMVSGMLSKMEFNFDIRLSSGNLSSGNTNNALNTYLQTLRQNQDEMRVQVSTLLLFNMFAMHNTNNILSNANSQVNITSYTNQILSSALGSMVFSQINNSLNNLIKSKKVNLEFIYNAYNTYQMGTVGGSNALSIQDLRNQIGLNMNVKMTDRFNLRISPGIDFNLYNSGGSQSRGIQSTNANTNIGFLPNVNLAYSLTKDGMLTVNAFNTSSFDNLIQSQRNRAGISLLLSKDFDLPKHKKKQTDSTQRKKKIKTYK